MDDTKLEVRKFTNQEALDRFIEGAKKTGLALFKDNNQIKGYNVLKKPEGRYQPDEKLPTPPISG